MNIFCVIFKTRHKKNNRFPKLFKDLSITRPSCLHAHVCPNSVTLFLFLSAGESEYVCQDIDYFPEESYQPDQQDATMAIPCELFASLSYGKLYFVPHSLKQLT
jgi:hypothetical protein